MIKKFSVSLLALVLAATALQFGWAQPASAYPGTTVNLSGHGFGHGRGLGQYGALGYAVDDGWSASQILDRYYGGTTAGASAGNPTIGVSITANDGKDAIITAGVNFTVGGDTFAANSATRLRRLGDGNFAIDRADNCGGAGNWNQVAVKPSPVSISSTSGGDALGNMLQLCMSGATVGFRGGIEVKDAVGALRVVNNLPVEDYLRGVVPRESPASWGDLGGGKGAQALRAQAVAARSYVLAAPHAPVSSFATTCDTISCQVYGGAYKNGEYIEDARTNAAIAATSGQVRRNGSGTVQRTEFSSSTGGYTAGGTFPAVVDDGDDYSGNPNHNWTASLLVSDVQGKYPSVGNLDSISIDSRNGLGDWGGRVSTMTLRGSGGSVTVSGADFRAKMGLKSDWFQITNSPSGGTNGYWLLGSDGGIFSFGGASFYGSMGSQRLNQPMVAMAPRTGSQGYWLVARDGGIFSYGSAQFKGSMGGKPLNSPVVGATSTPSGDGYWMVAADGGIFAFGDAGFYGSMGGKPLNKPIVGMTPTASGKGYWLVASDGGIFAFGDAGFFGSTGNISLRQPVVSIVSTPSGKGYWMAAADGGVFAYGDAPYQGSLPGSKITATVTSITRTATGNGYLMTTNNGVVHSFGDAPQFGSLPGVAPGFKGTVLSISPVY